MKNILLLVVLLFSAVWADYAVTTGPNYYVVGINLNIGNGTANAYYNIYQPNDSSIVREVLQDAITRIGLDGGGIIHLTKGVYTIDDQLFVYHNFTHIRGEGIDKTIIRLDNFAPSFINGTGKGPYIGLIRSYLVDDLIISNLTVDGNKFNQYNDSDSEYGRHGIVTVGGNNIVIDFVKAINFQGYGFNQRGRKMNNIWGSNLDITNCISQNNDRDGFLLAQILSAHVYHCEAIGNGRHGFNIVNGTTNIEMQNNTALLNGYDDVRDGCGITIQNNPGYITIDVFIRYNNLTTNKKSGLCLFYVLNVTVQNNFVDDTYSCFNFHNATQCIVTNNVCQTTKLMTNIGTFISDDPTNTFAVYFANNTFIRTTDDGTTDGTTGTTTTTGGQPGTTSHNNSSSDGTNSTYNSILLSILVIILCNYI